MYISCLFLCMDVGVYIEYTFRIVLCVSSSEWHETDPSLRNLEEICSCVTELFVLILLDSCGFLHLSPFLFPPSSLLLSLSLLLLLPV